MQFQKFKIENFKGIQLCEIDVRGTAPRVYSLIGLNESGKTTILEAINYFVAGDVDLQKIYNIESATVDKSTFVPKSKKANFNGSATVAATLMLEPVDIDALDRAMQKEGYRLDRDVLPSTIEVTQNFIYKNSDYQKSERRFPITFKAFKGKSLTSKKVDNSHACWSAVWKTITARIPQICYFPTFLFDMPDKIYLEESDGENPVNRYYRRLLQDILDSLHEGLNIQEHIVDRIRKSDGSWSWFSFLQTDRREQVNHVLLKASSKVTSVIMDSWRKVFNRGFDSKRIEFEYGHDAELDSVYIKIFLVDIRNAEKYEIGDRSLGFRWFFCFWIFTYFRALRIGVSGVAFLFDEPASNLHARAQEELLASMAGLSDGNNLVIYSTHSHYLINPAWLDRSYIVRNEALNYEGIEDEFLSGGETNIKVMRYKEFVAKNPNQRTYFLPVLDALDYRPSQLTLERPSLIVEGKCDFAFLTLALGNEKNFGIVPGGGAQSLGPIIGLLTGWGFRNVVLLDDDKEGKDALKKYQRDWYLQDDQIKTIAEFDGGSSGKSLETFLLAELRQALIDHFEISEPKKEHVQMFLFQKLAEGDSSFMTARLQGTANKVSEWAISALLGAEELRNYGVELR